VNLDVHDNFWNIKKLFFEVKDLKAILYIVSVAVIAVHNVFKKISMTNLKKMNSENERV